MFSATDKTDKVIAIMNKHGLQTKNVPSAMNWHSSFFWKHLDFLDYKEASNISYDTLSNYVAIGILLNKSEEFYHNLALEIISVME